MKPATCRSYDFVDNPYDKGAFTPLEKGKKLLDVTVAVVDGLRVTEVPCFRKELIFLHPDGLVDYKAIPIYCRCCQDQSVCQASSINSHGFFCASIVASKELHDALCGGVNLGSLRGLAPPPRISLFGVGCPVCGYFSVKHLGLGVSAAMKTNVAVISLSCTQGLPVDQDYFFLDDVTFEAFKKGILVVVPAGNDGENHLRSVANYPPWCLSVGSCSTIWYKCCVEFRTNLENLPFDKFLEGRSIAKFAMSEFLEFRVIGNIFGVPCKMFRRGDQIVIVDKDYALVERNTPVVHISAENAMIISNLMKDSSTCKNGFIAVKITSTGFEPPKVATFSGRGPCPGYGAFMKPELLAPGQNIAACWPTDVPIEKGSDIFAEFNVKDGTSCAVPHVAAAAAMVMALKNFSASAAFSAAITTATKMHGTDPIGREFSYGAGLLNIQKMMRPGGVYEEDPMSYESWKNGDLPHYDLNLPYISARFPPGFVPWQCTFQRKLRNTEDHGAIFHGEVIIHDTTLSLSKEEIKDSIVVNPDILVFETFGSVLHFSVDVCLRKRVSKKFIGLISASLRWKKEGEEEVEIVSPIFLSSNRDPDAVTVDSWYKSVS